MRWTDEETIQLIELYKSYHYLWDSSSELYKNAVARKQAYEFIVKHMGIPRLKAQDVRCKIKNLRSSYYHELRKRDKYGNDRGGPCRKLTWFTAFKPIMGAINATKGSMTESETSEDDAEESPFIEESTSTANAYVVSIKQEYLDEMERHDGKVIAPITDYLEPAPKRAKQQEPINLVDKSEENFPTTSSPKRIDEFQMFSNNVASQLRKLPLDRALIIQVEVQSLIAKERIRAFKKQNERGKEDDSQYM